MAKLQTSLQFLFFGYFFLFLNRFLHKLRLHTDIFPMESINCIFSNIEDILHFQEAFLDALKTGIRNHSIAKVFLSHQAAFSVYSTYCNAHPRGFMELEKYTGNKVASEILERYRLSKFLRRGLLMNFLTKICVLTFLYFCRCRKSEKLPELPLTAHLLAPIQRICRYPLHLSELVKYFPSNPNFQRDVKKDQEMMDCKESFELALATVKKVAEMVNEGRVLNLLFFRTHVLFLPNKPRPQETESFINKKRIAKG